MTAGALTAQPTHPDLTGGLLIGPDWVHETSVGTMDHVSAATGRRQARFPVAGEIEVDRAVAAARAALPGWRRTPAVERAAVLHRLADLLRRDTDRLARVTTLENGTPIAMAGAHAPAAASWFDYYAGWTDKLTGGVQPTPGSLNYTRPEPVGVVAVVLTWNGPTASIGMKAAAALAAGCTVVLKPPELAPFSASHVGALALEAGLPPGVLNIVPGGPAAGERLARHTDVDKISFTGSPQTAARIQAACAASLTPLVLELGGKSAQIVLADADLDSAARTAAIGIAALSGQVCVAPTRLIVEDAVHDEVVERVTAVLGSLPLGDPMDPATFVGPLVNQVAKQRVADVVEGARRRGDGRCVAGGEPVEGELAAGAYVRPTVFVDVDNAAPLAQEEVFGPVLSVMRVAGADEAVELANATRFGLAAYVHTRDLTRALDLADRLDAGTVAVNDGRPIPGPETPFGGFKDSGYGKEGGLEGLLEYVRLKNVNIGTAR